MNESRIISLQVGLPAEHGADAISQKSWQSGIFKDAVHGQVFLDTLNLRGDGQHDLHNHGGEYRAVLAYAVDHYPTWNTELACELPFGAFGENFTVTGYDEDTVCIGDVFVVGEARVQVSQPRMPCWKLARRWGIKDLTARVDQKAWGGWYHRVLQTGYVQAGDAYLLTERPYPNLSIKRLYDLMDEREIDVAAFRQLAGMENILTPSWRTYYAKYAEQYADTAQS
jgi:MOSC domain-containing protein YiiM